MSSPCTSHPILCMCLFFVALMPRSLVIQCHYASRIQNHVGPMRPLLLDSNGFPWFLLHLHLTSEDQMVSILLIYGPATFSFLEALLPKGMSSTSVLFGNILGILMSCSHSIIFKSNESFNVLVECD